MERKQLKVFVDSEGITRVGVGATSTTPRQLTAFEINSRAREVAYLKRAKIAIFQQVPGAAWAYDYLTLLQREPLFADRTKQNSLVARLDGWESDSYTYLSGRDQIAVYQPLWEWPEGFEPVFTENPYILNYMDVLLNAGTFLLRFVWEFQYWIEVLPEREYEKLKLKYGKLG